MVMKVQGRVMLALVAILVGGGRGEEHPRVLCGRNLAEARLLYCFSTEENDNTQKRSIPDTAAVSVNKVGNDGSTNKLVANPGNKQQWGWHRSQALALGSRAKRYQGLVDECCYKACYVSELLNYC